MEDKNIIIILLCVIIAILVVGCVVISAMNNNESVSESSDVDNSTTTVVNENSNDDSPHSISVMSEMDETVKKTVGDYTLEVYKWGGSNLVGGLDITLYKNGQRMNKYSYESRAYYYDGEWKWSDWDYGGKSQEFFHRYPVSNTVEIQEVEVRF